jgi:predicted nucleic acid-binding protein
VILVDTSVWIATFRARAPLDLERFVAFDDIVTCLPVVQEVLQGFRDEGPFRRARESMFALPMIESPITAPVFLQAIDLYRAGRRAGVTIRSSVDCLIAACALRHDLEVLHVDRDFAALARISPLRERQARP